MTSRDKGGFLRMVRETVSVTTDFFLAPNCMACNGPLPPTMEKRGSMELLCEPCRELLHPINPRNQCPRCGAAPSRPPKDLKGAGGRCERCEFLPDSFRATIAVFPYLSSAGRIVRNMKYSRGPWLARHLVNLAWPHLHPRLEEWVAGDERSQWVIIPAPMHALREMARGYNQAREIAEQIAGGMELALLGDRALQRVRKGKPQARFHTREERMENLVGCYRTRDNESVRGRKIILVDDVMTSGATMTAGSMELLRAGAKEVRVVVMLRAQISQDQVMAPGP